MTDAPPNGEMHLIISKTLPAQDVENLDNWARQQGMQLVRVGENDNDYDCIMIPDSDPEPATTTGVPHIEPRETPAQMQEHIDEQHVLMERLGSLLTDIASALRGEPVDPEGKRFMHDWSSLPLGVATLKAGVEELLADVNFSRNETDEDPTIVATDGEVHDVGARLAEILKDTEVKW